MCHSGFTVRNFSGALHSLLPQFWYFNYYLMTTIPPFTQFILIFQDELGKFPSQSMLQVNKKLLWNPIIRDSIAAGLNLYQNVWVKFLQPLKTWDCTNGGDKVQHVLWRAHNLSVVKSVKKVVAFCSTNNLN